MNKRMRRIKRERGQSMVEFSFLAIFLVILLSGVADFGRAYFIFLEMRDAAQEGAAFGSFSPMDFTGIEARVRDTMKEPVDMSDPALVTVTTELTNPPYACSGFHPLTLSTNRIKVTISYEMPIAVPFLGSILGSQVLPLEAAVEDTILTPSCTG
jgi:hypothetical protein